MPDEEPKTQSLPITGEVEKGGITSLQGGKGKKIGEGKKRKRENIDKKTCWAHRSEDKINLMGNRKGRTERSHVLSSKKRGKEEKEEHA